MNAAFWEALLAGLGFMSWGARKKDQAPKKTDKPA